MLFLLLMLQASVIFAKVKLPALVSDGMVLQRDKILKIWGWADPREAITLTFHNQIYETITGEKGRWSLMLPAMDPGGPYTMTIKGKNEIKVNDILIGDVWLCSGQSNMAFNMERIKEKYADEVGSSTNRNIRQFLIKPSWNFVLQEDVQSEGWKQANPENILSFTAVGYFYARALYKITQVPIGIINSSYSATVAEAWMSEQGLRDFPEYVAETNKYKDPAKVKEVLNADEKLKSNWMRLANTQDKGLSPNGSWIDPSMDISTWDTLNAPGYWNKPGIKNMPGVLWMVKEIDIPARQKGIDASLYFGGIDDRDSTYFNGIKVGHSYMRGRSRNYTIPGNLVKAGKNRIMVRIVNPDGPGGFYPDKNYLFISGNTRIDLTGSWKYRVGTKLPALKSNQLTKFNCKPAALFNSMIFPLTSYAIKGVVWYQGEGNAGRAYEYRKLFSSLIVDWRARFRQGNFPFLFVQLANFGKVRSEPSESSWAELREAQTMALALPATGMAVTHDIGEANDIHPLDKKTVGERLSLIAQQLAYNKSLVSSGPVYNSSIVKGDKILVNFKNTGSGLSIQGSHELGHFTIAGEDKRFVWAKAKIENNAVLVWSEEVKYPVAVRYAWADNPVGANLYNKEGLPASSFRTDSWSGKTFTK